MFGDTSSTGGLYYTCGVSGGQANYYWHILLCSYRLFHLCIFRSNIWSLCKKSLSFPSFSHCCILIWSIFLTDSYVSCWCTLTLYVRISDISVKAITTSQSLTFVRLQQFQVVATENLNPVAVEADVYRASATEKLDGTCCYVTGFKGEQCFTCSCHCWFRLFIQEVNEKVSL